MLQERVGEGPTGLPVTVLADRPCLFQFQFAVFRLISESREPPPQEGTAGFPWSATHRPVDWQRAALSLWRQRALQELLKEKQFRVGARPSSVPLLVLCPERPSATGAAVELQGSALLGLGTWG